MAIPRQLRNLRGEMVSTLAVDSSDLLPNDDDVAHYVEHGWWVSPVVLDDNVLDDAVRGAARHWAGERDWALSISGGFKDWTPESAEPLRVGEIIALRNKELRALSLTPVIGAIAARLAGTDAIRLWESELIEKPPRPAGTRATVGWHTDRAYWMTCTSTAMLTAWIPFHDCPAELGPLMVVDGSHRWNDVDHDQLRRFQDTDLEEFEQELLRTRPDARISTMALKRGQISFHNTLALHASRDNVGSRSRQCLALHLQDAANRYRPFYNQEGELWEVVADRLCRKGPDGQPDYTDPSVCPTIWPVVAPKSEP